jgi:fructose-1,6-bisphosphatase II / sedoheptulose-1,7-bisphosphatase
MPKASALTSILAYAMIRATEATAAAAERLVGAGDEAAADEAAASAMRAALDAIDMDGAVVVGDGEAAGADVLGAGRTVGSGKGAKIDIALDALEGPTLAAKAMPNAIAVLAAAPRGGILRVPNIYMDKIAIGPGFAKDVIDLDAPPGDNALKLAAAKGVDVRDLTVCVLDRPRHDRIIADLRRVGARINLISDGDVAGVIHTAYPETRIDMYLGVGGAPEGVLAAAALRCVGGQIQARMACRTEADRQKAASAGIKDLTRRYELDDLVSSETIFVATGVTGGDLLDGVRRVNGSTHTHSLMMTSFDGMIRTIRSVTPQAPPASVSKSPQR